MAVTKTLIETYAGDTIQRTIPVTLTVDGVSVTDMTGWLFRFAVDTEPETVATPVLDDLATAEVGFAITKTQTSTWLPGTYTGYGKLQASTGEEFTVLEITFVVSSQGVD